MRLRRLGHCSKAKSSCGPASLRRPASRRWTDVRQKTAAMRPLADCGGEKLEGRPRCPHERAPTAGEGRSPAGPKGATVGQKRKEVAPASVRPPETDV